MVGLHGNDETDLEDDREELFGSSADPVEVGDTAGDGAAGAAAGDGAAGAINGKRKRNATSRAWLYFEKIYSIVNGKKVRTGAKCFHCGHKYAGLAGQSRIGTGHLLRHIETCDKRKENKRLSQSLLSFSSDGSVCHWEYNVDRARTGLCHLIARLCLPLCVGAHPAFEEYIRDCHNPRFTLVSAQTAGRDLIKYPGLREKLIAYFANVSSVSITSYIWSGNAKEDYLSVVAHYVNPNWQLEKRVIGFRLIDESHFGDNIVERVSVVLDEYGLMAKVFSVTLDNASSNNKAIETLAPNLYSYVGTIDSLEPFFLLFCFLIITVFLQSQNNHVCNHIKHYFCKFVMRCKSCVH
jgi:hypothetical protein